MLFQNSPILFLVFIVLFSPITHADQSQIIKLTSGDWHPFLSPNLKSGGYVADIAIQAFKAVDYEVEFGYFKWSESLKLARTSNNWHGSLIWVKNDDRQKDFAYTDPIVVLSTVFFFNKSERFVWKTLDDLEGYKIAVTKSYHYGSDFHKLANQNYFTTTQVATDLEGLSLVANLEVTAFPLVREVGLYYKHTSRTKAIFEGVKFHPNPLSTKPHHIIISKRYPNAVRWAFKFNEGLKRIKENGILEKIIKSNLEGAYYKSSN